MSTKLNHVKINPLDLYTKNQLCSISSNMWSRPATALLIEMYRKLECLWKTNSVYYRNKKRRHDALQEIALAIAPFRPDTTVEDVKNKINGIRTQYVAEKNKVSFYAKKNPSMEYEPSLWCYDRLSFLAAYTSLKNKSISEATAVNLIPNNDDGETAEKRLHIKIEDSDETELIESQDFNTGEDDEHDLSQQPLPYINIQPYRKKTKILCESSEEENSNAIQTMLLSSNRPEISLIKSSKHTNLFPTSSADLRDEESTNIPQRSEESDRTETDDWIDVFGKFVSTQMKLITNKTLLIQLQHTIQSAIMNTQLKQIELDRQ